jgi:TRAP-type mannitol/chloroaromatic compound transport system permease small subunit
MADDAEAGHHGGRLRYLRVSNLVKLAPGFKAAADRVGWVENRPEVCPNARKRTGKSMQTLLKLSRLIDAANERIGRFIGWLVLGAVLVSAGNALVRKVFQTSSNALLELQWYLFAAVFLLGAGYTFLRNAHVRVDFLSSRFSARTRNWIDSVGLLVFLIPLCLVFIKLSWPLVVNAWVSGEMSQNAGGLIRWPVYLMVPLGFGLLLLQSVSELIKRSAFLCGWADDPLGGHLPHASEEPR